MTLLMLRGMTEDDLVFEGDLEENLRIAKANTASFSILNIHLDPQDRSEALARFAVRLARQAGLKG